MKFSKMIPLALVAAMACAFTAHAAEVGGQKVDDVAVVSGNYLKLNGAGIRSIGPANIYLVALYLTKKQNTAEGAQSVAGPKRLSLNFQRDVKAADLGQLFVTAANKNSTKEQKAQVVNQITQLGEIFGELADFKKGDLLTVDWNPEKKSTTVAVNGKAAGAPLSDEAFFNAVLRIWVHEPSVYPELTAQVLGK